jgi:biotin carboxyl carrier protein
MRFRILVDGEAHEIEVEGAPPAMTVRVDGASYRTRVSRPSDGFQVRVGAGTYHVAVRGNQVFVDGQLHEVAAEATMATGGSLASQSRAGNGGVFEIRPPMPGRVVRVRVAAGDHVKRGQTLLVLEAMKMQNEIPAPEDGIVRSLSVRKGESISGDRVIAVLESR